MPKSVTLHTNLGDIKVHLRHPSQQCANLICHSSRYSARRSQRLLKCVSVTRADHATCYQHLHNIHLLSLICGLYSYADPIVSIRNNLLLLSSMPRVTTETCSWTTSANHRYTYPSAWQCGVWSRSLPVSKFHGCKCYLTEISSEASQRSMSTYLHHCFQIRLTFK